eukprot:366166-Chlamydomonas_euryale.AAC.4
MSTGLLLSHTFVPARRWPTPNLVSDCECAGGEPAPHCRPGSSMKLSAGARKHVHVGVPSVTFVSAIQPENQPSFNLVDSTRGATGVTGQLARSSHWASNSASAASADARAALTCDVR